MVSKKLRLQESEDTLAHAPLGIKAAGKLCTCRTSRRDYLFQALVLVLTYVAYVSYRIARKPSSVVKNVLNRNCTGLMDIPPDVNVTEDPDWCHWEPFSGNKAETLLGALDSSLLAGYAVGMFISGYLAERLPLRYFLVGGMCCGACCSILLGSAYFWKIHIVYYFLILQTLNGLFQSTGWPTVVKCVSNWFGQKNRGLVFGVWSSHLFIGSILGKIIPGIFVEDNWGLSFMVPGFIMLASATICLFFLPTDPYQVCCTPPKQSEKQITKDVKNTEAISVLQALKIPGVPEYSFASFCTKLVSYSFTYWLTRYIKLTTTHSAQNSAFLATLYDIGGIAGSALAGIISDRLLSRSITCGLMQLLTAPAMILYWYVGNITLGTSVAFLLLVGILVNGPYTLILTTISADLGNHKEIKDNSEAMATVAGIINGCGSIGGAIGPFLAGYLTETDVHNVFWMLMVADLLGLLCLSRIIVKDIYKCVKRLQGKTSASLKGSKDIIPIKQIDSTVEMAKV